jgi:hypothetical protein
LNEAPISRRSQKSIPIQLVNFNINQVMSWCNYIAGKKIKGSQMHTAQRPLVHK